MQPAGLALHNSLRARHGAAPLSWDDSLAGAAQQWAEGCVMQHSNGGWGENLAMGYSSPDGSVQVCGCLASPQGDGTSTHVPCLDMLTKRVCTVDLLTASSKWSKSPKSMAWPVCSALLSSP